jgi:hypothetical protein
MVNVTPRPLYFKESNPLYIVEKAVWATARLGGCGKSRSHRVYKYYYYHYYYHFYHHCYFGRSYY